MTAPAWQPLGDRAIRFARPAGPARAIAAAVRAWPGVVDVVVAPDDVAAYFTGPPAVDVAWLAALAHVRDEGPPPSEVVLAATYDGPDLGEVARAAGMAPDEVARVHAAATYVVEAIGFAPGFAYLGGVDRRLALPRRATPRPRVPAGSLAIAGGFTAVYPFDSPGGWHLIGRVEGAMFGPDGARLQLGDRVRFAAARPRDAWPLATLARGAAAAPPLTRAGNAPDGASGGVRGGARMTLEVTRAAGLVTVQDLGRPGHLHAARAPGGALVREWLVAANRAAGNRDGAAALEVLGALEVVARAAVVVASERWGARPLRTGEALVVDSAPDRVTYLALRGGVAAPRVLGGCGTQLSAGIGARLVAGDRVDAASEAGAVAPRVGALPAPAGAPIRVIAGPDADAFEPGVLDVLASAAYRISPASDRVGTRLVGPVLPRRAGYVERSRPMVCGAIEVPRDGAPIVLGPEHPTTGGYPVVGVVAHEDVGRLFAIPLGGAVRFAIG